MLVVDLSALRGPELRRLLARARELGDGAFADSVERELAARGADGRRQAIDVEAPPFPMDPPPRAGDAAPEPSSFRRPRGDGAPPILAGPVWGQGAGPPRPPADAAPPGRRGGMGGVALLVVGALAGSLAAVAGMQGTGVREAGAPAAAQAAPRMMAAMTEPTPGLRDTLPVELEPPPPPELEPEPAPELLAPTPASARPRAEPPRTEPPRAGRRAPKATRMAARSVAPGRARSTQDCAAQPLAADRMVCADAALAALHRRRAQAYANAVAARADTLELEEVEAAWRRARDATTDPQRLAQLYDLRIRELNAAAAVGRAREEPPY